MEGAPPVGTLSWRPFEQASDLLPAVVAEAGVPGPTWVAPVDPELADTAEFCRHYEVSPAQSANCVIVEGRRGESVTLAAVLVLAIDRADVNKAVRKHLGVRKISFAPMDTATQLTGMEYGGITAIGLPQEWPILIDTAVTEAGLVVIGGGNRSAKLLSNGADLAKLSQAEVVALAQPRD